MRATWLLAKARGSAGPQQQGMESQIRHMLPSKQSQSVKHCCNPTVGLFVRTWMSHQGVNVFGKIIRHTEMTIVIMRVLMHHVTYTITGNESQTALPAVGLPVCP